MKFHKATLVGLSKTSASLESVGQIEAQEIITGGYRISGSRFQIFDSSSQDYVTIISPLENGAYIVTASVEEFPLEVSRSAASYGFTGGGGGNLDNALITASANGNVITF